MKKRYLIITLFSLLLFSVIYLGNAFINGLRLYSEAEKNMVIAYDIASSISAFRDKEGRLPTSKSDIQPLCRDDLARLRIIFTDNNDDVLLEIVVNKKYKIFITKDGLVPKMVVKGGYLDYWVPFKTEPE